MADNSSDVKVRITTEDKTKAGTDSATGNFKKFKGTLADTALGLAATGVAVTILMNQINKAVTSASNLSETINKAQVVFGSAAEEIIKFGDSASESMGMSKQAAIEAAGTFGNLFVSMGMTTDISADMSTSLVKLAGDLASFNNIDPTVALEKLRSGLVGETEPLRALGVNLNEAGVQARALEMGLAASAKELTAADKAYARYTLILEQTKTAQGDFTRTSEGLANQQRINKALMEDLSGIVGNKFIPAYQGGTKALNDIVKWFIASEDAMNAQADSLEANYGRIAGLGGQYGNLAAQQRDVVLETIGMTEAEKAARDMFKKNREAAKGYTEALEELPVGFNLADDAAVAYSSSMEHVAEVIRKSPMNGDEYSAALRQNAEDIKLAAQDLAGARDQLAAAESAWKDRVAGGFEQKLEQAKPWELTEDDKNVFRSAVDEVYGTGLVAAEELKVANEKIWQDFLKTKDKDKLKADLEELAKAFMPLDKSVESSTKLVETLQEKLNELERTYNVTVHIGVTGNLDGLPTGGDGSSSGKTGKPIGATAGEEEYDGRLAGGGPVRAGRPYLVGELGPELFAPATNGTIIPNDQIGNVDRGDQGSQGSPVVNNFYVYDITDWEAAASRISRIQNKGRR